MGRFRSATRNHEFEFLATGKMTFALHRTHSRTDQRSELHPSSGGATRDVGSGQESSPSDLAEHCCGRNTRRYDFAKSSAKKRFRRIRAIQDIKIDNRFVARKVGSKYFTLAQPENVMKLSPIFSFKAIASLAVVALWTYGLQAQNASSRTVRVTGLAGSARYSHGGDAFVPLGLGTKLGKGDVIKTGAGSHVDLDMGGNVGVVQVAPSSTFSIDEVTATSTGTDVLTDTQLSLTSGAMYAKVQARQRLALRNYDSQGNRRNPRLGSLPHSRRPTDHGGRRRRHGLWGQ
jgi:hypothetical protein